MKIILKAVRIDESITQPLLDIICLNYQVVMVAHRNKTHVGAGLSGCAGDNSKLVCKEVPGVYRNGM